MANLQHLIAALGKVADAYAPYAPDPNDDPDGTDDPNDDPANDDGDPLDDPRSYTDDDDDPNKDDDDDEDDFSKPKIFSTVMLLQKLEHEADLRFRTEWKARNQEMVRRNTRPPSRPPSKTDQNRAQLLRLKKLTAETENELALECQVENQFQQYIEARKRRNRRH
jgi:hypothetical protein